MLGEAKKQQRRSPQFIKINGGSAVNKRESAQISISKALQIIKNHNIKQEI